MLYRKNKIDFLKGLLKEARRIDEMIQVHERQAGKCLSEYAHRQTINRITDSLA